MNTSTKPLSGSRVGIFGKGGSGKSTVTVLLARALRNRRYPVCVLDADSSNVGLHDAIGVERPPEPLVDYFGGMVFSGGAVTCPVDDPTSLTGAVVSIEELPGRYVGRTKEGIWLLATGKMGERGPGAGCDGPMAKIARDLRVQVKGEECLTLVDFKAGFEDSARGVVVGFDRAVAVVDPTSAAPQLAIHLISLVNRIKRGDRPATEHLEDPELVEAARRLFREARIQDVLVVLNRVDAESARHLLGVLSRRGVHPVATIRMDPRVSISWLKGVRLEAREASEDVEELASALEGHAPRLSPIEVPVHPGVTY